MPPCSPVPLLAAPQQPPGMLVSRLSSPQAPKPPRIALRRTHAVCCAARCRRLNAALAHPPTRCAPPAHPPIHNGAGRLLCDLQRRQLWGVALSRKLLEEGAGRWTTRCSGGCGWRARGDACINGARTHVLTWSPLLPPLHPHSSLLAAASRLTGSEWHAALGGWGMWGCGCSSQHLCGASCLHVPRAQH
jgi:hypothetical protein